MAYETGSATDIEDLIAKISTFAVANGWTEDRRDNVNGIFGMSKNSIFVSFRWDPATPEYLSIHQATIALPASSTEPGDVTGDSGNGYNASTSHANFFLSQERHFDLEGDGPYPSYTFFEQDASPAYLHIVVESSTNVFKHMGFGEIEKYGNWTGGDYVYGQKHAVGIAAQNNNSTFLLDGLFTDNSDTDQRWAATISVSGMPDQDGSEVWGQVWGSAFIDPPQDSALNEKATVQGGYRGGPHAHPFALFSATKDTGLIPMYPFSLWYVDKVTKYVYLLGYQPDVRGVNLRGIAPKEEIVIGSDTWIFFPAQQRDGADTSGTTGYQGVAYKKVTA